MLMASNGAPVGLDNIRCGWQQVEVEQRALRPGLRAGDVHAVDLRGQEPRPGTYDVAGLKSELTIEDWGPNLKIPGAVITGERRRHPLLGQPDPARPAGRRGRVALRPPGQGTSRRATSSGALIFADHVRDRFPRS